MGDTAYIYAPVNCDFCTMEGLEVQAQFDGKTIHGPWAYMCNEHFGAMGIGLGTGRGQRLIVGERPATDQSDADIEEYGAAEPEEASSETTAEKQSPEADKNESPEEENPKFKLNLMMNWRDMWP